MIRARNTFLKMNKAFILIGFAVLVVGCEKIDTPGGTPNCIKNKIEEIAEGEVWNPPAKIYRYQYNGQTVYYFPSRCCDIPSILYDENCIVICSPDGGFIGNGDGRCPDFFSSRTDEKLIWEDLRE